MDIGIDTLPFFLRRCHGALAVCGAPGLHPKAALHRCLLWVPGPDDLLFDGGEYTEISCSENALLSPSLAPQHNSHAVLGPRPAGLPDLVSCELLPNGLHRSATSHYIWFSQSHGLDAGLSAGRAKSGSSVGLSPENQSLAMSSQEPALCFKVALALVIHRNAPMEAGMGMYRYNFPGGDPAIKKIKKEWR